MHVTWREWMQNQVWTEEGGGRLERRKGGKVERKMWKDCACDADIVKTRPHEDDAANSMV